MSPQTEQMAREMFSGAELAEAELIALLEKDVEGISNILRDVTLSSDERYMYEVLLNEAGGLLAKLEVEQGLS